MAAHTPVAQGVRVALAVVCVVCGVWCVVCGVCVLGRGAGQ